MFSTLDRSDIKLSDRIEFKLGFILPVLAENAHRSIMNSSDPKEGFRRFLKTSYSITRASIPLMECAEKQCNQIREAVTENEELIMPLRNYYREHCSDEKNHDNWLLEDLETVGVDRKEVLSARPSENVVELVGTQYYLIFHSHPLNLLGYIAVLEGHPSDPIFLGELAKITDFPSSAFRTLLEHSSLDLRHRDEFYEMLNHLPLTPEQEEAITLNAIYTVKKCAAIMKVI